MFKSLRAKFIVDEVVDVNEHQTDVKLRAVQSDENSENQDFNKYTPSGELTMMVDNPDAKGFFVQGKEFYLDFTSVE